MEQEKILSEITTRVGKTSLSQRTLTDYVNNNLPTEGTEPDDAFWEKHVGFLKSLDGNFSHDVSTQVEEFKKNYKPQSQQQFSDTENDLKNRLEVLEKERELERNNKQIDGLRTGVQEKGKELKVSNKNLWNDAVRTVTYQDGMTSESMLNEAKSIYEARLKSYFGDGEIPYGGEQKGVGSQVSSEEVNAKRQAFRQKMVAQGRLPEEEK